MPLDLPQEALAQLMDALEKGRTIDAIKHYRAATGHGLKESKEAVEQLYAELHQQDPERFPERKKTAGCSSSAAILAVLFCVVFYFANQA
ncbi:hypothetical protein [Pelagicoccus mobilis]|uniref:Ribosomal protein L7/L12 C-terminal domain-containing protein n=1 Tax=Pelagicoccus mobilis TaxID=415221 RepID=A0A934VSR4_9BACT|nr:hypothetical protein [Pelagicoccus mobilis]MBK1879290.1 hypothetical protein [Pelagicoccus mobilis]